MTAPTAGRGGRLADGCFDEKAAIVEMRRLIDEREGQLAAGPEPGVISFDEVAADWLHHVEHVDGGKSSTVKSYRWHARPVPASWRAVVAAAAVHAIGTLSVAVGAIRWTTLTEHLSPETAARLEEEGVSDPDRRLTELVQEYTAPRGARVARARALSTAFDEQTVAATDDPARAAVEQRTA